MTTPHDNKLAARTRAILDDLHSGKQPLEVAKAHGVTRQWVHIVRKRAGIPLPPPAPKHPWPVKPKAPKPPRPMSPRTAAVLADVRAGLLYAEIAARHGITEFYVGCLARQHGIGRSTMQPNWRTRPRPGTRHPDTDAIVRDLRAGMPYGEAAAKYA